MQLNNKDIFIIAAITLVLIFWVSREKVLLWLCSHKLLCIQQDKVDVSFEQEVENCPVSSLNYDKRIAARFSVGVPSCEVAAIQMAINEFMPPTESVKPLVYNGKLDYRTVSLMRAALKKSGKDTTTDYSLQEWLSFIRNDKK